MLQLELNYFMLSTYRKANDLEELKKAVFSVNTVKVKEHDIEKAKAKIQDLHRYKNQPMLMHFIPPNCIFVVLCYILKISDLFIIIHNRYVGYI